MKESRLRNGLFGINQAFGRDFGEYFVEIFSCFPSRHIEIHELIVTAVARSGTRNLTFKVGNKFVGFHEQR